MRHRSTLFFLLVSAAAMMPLLCPPLLRAQAASACDLNADGSVDALDVQLATNMALGVAPCSANVAGPGVCDIVVIQRVINTVLGGSCVTGIAHNVTLNWTASTSANVVGYYVYRGAATGGPYIKVNATPVAAVTYTDYGVQAGATYYYVATAVDSSGNESAYSNEAPAAIPTP